MGWEMGREKMESGQFVFQGAQAQHVAVGKGH